MCISYTTLCILYKSMTHTALYFVCSASHAGGKVAIVFFSNTVCAIEGASGSIAFAVNTLHWWWHDATISFFFFIFRDGTFSGAPIATCTSSPESVQESWCAGSPGCISPSPALESSYPCWLSSSRPLGLGPRKSSRGACQSCGASLPAAACELVLWAWDGPAYGHWDAGSRGRRSRSLEGNWPPTGSRNRKWRAR